MSRENVEVVRAMFAAFEVRDIDSLVRDAHPEIELRPALVGGLEGTVYRGREGYRQFVADVDSIWDDFRAQAEEFRDLGNSVLVLGRASGRGKGSGVQVDAPAGWVCTMRDGKVHRFASFTREDALEAVGLTE
jgi:ketosteroid isomerase-like protein